MKLRMRLFWTLGLISIFIPIILGAPKAPQNRHHSETHNHEKVEAVEKSPKSSSRLNGIFSMFDGIFANTNDAGTRDALASLPSIKHDHTKKNPLYSSSKEPSESSNDQDGFSRPKRPSYPNEPVRPIPKPSPQTQSPPPSFPNQGRPSNSNRGSSIPSFPIRRPPPPQQMPIRPPPIPQNHPSFPSQNSGNRQPQSNPLPEREFVENPHNVESQQSIPNRGGSESRPSPPPSFNHHFNFPNRPPKVNLRHPSFFPPNKKPFSPGIPNRVPEVRPLPEPIPEKFLPSFTPEPKEPCIGVNGSRIGECIDAYTCGESGGDIVGLCDENPKPRVCCSHVSFCNYESNMERVYLNNPSYPEPLNKMNKCGFRLNPVPGVCQVRLDFLDFHMKPPSSVNGLCDDDNALHIESNNPNSYVPVKKLCGTLSEDKWDPLAEDIPHLYVHFHHSDRLLDLAPPLHPKNPSEELNMLTLNFKVKDHPSSWNVRLTQISCDDGARLEAPSGCGRYYTGENGTISSLNYKDGVYPTKMDLTTCIRRESGEGSCGIKYSLNPEKHGFSVGAQAGSKDILNFGLDCEGDYVSFSGQKAAFCGSIESATEFSFPKNVGGTLGLHHHSDSLHVNKKDVGYRLNYNFIRDCKNVDYFDYKFYNN